jgi:hypothetical protein
MKELTLTFLYEIANDQDMNDLHLNDYVDMWPVRLGMQEVLRQLKPKAKRAKAKGKGAQHHTKSKFTDGESSEKNDPKMKLYVDESDDE